jgi:RNA polymerase sigma factor (sigma-70 family)
MGTSDKTSVFQELDRLLRHGVAGSADGALVHRFVAERSELAFEALVARFGPMVRGVCQRVLADPHDADDAFQATFLVLVRKARQLRDPDRIGPWLYGVARRVATKARKRSARHRHESSVEVCAQDESSMEWFDVMPILDDELGRLSAKHRDVLILCLLDGASAQEAATRMGCPVGTVKSRLARARETLRDRLATRGIAPAVALAILSSTDAFSSPVSPALARATLELLGGSPVAPGVFALTRGVRSNMLPRSIVISSVLLGGVAIAGLGTASWLNSSTVQEPRPPRIAGNGPSGGRGPSEVRINNMKQILLAFHNYHSAAGRFPVVASYGGDGLPKLSWRVAILPYLGESQLYEEFRQNEPWDSPHNQALLQRMPAVFESPDSPAPPGQTRIQGFAGKGAMFEGVQGVTFQEVPDGASNTAFIALARDPVPWTKPGDIAFGDQAPPALDRSNRAGLAVGMTDGSVRSLPHSVGLGFLRSVITRAGGEVVVWPPAEAGPPTERRAAGGARNDPQFLPTTPAPTPVPVAPAPTSGAAVSPAPTSPETLEQRLRRVEEKLDRLLQRLEGLLPAETGKKP